MKRLSFLGREKYPFSFLIHKTGPIGSVLRHDHDFWELAYIYSGQGRCEQGDEVFDFQAQQMILTPPYVPHAFEVAEGQLHEQVSLTIYPQVLADAEVAGVKVEALLNAIMASGRCWVSLSAVNAARAEVSLASMCREYEFQGPHFDAMLAMEIARLLILWERTLTDTRSMFLRMTDLPVVLHEVLQRVESDYAKLSGLPDLMGDTHLNERYFIRLFKKHVGMPPVQYLNRVRIEKCAALLLHNAQSIAEVAYAVGFGDLRFFNRLFKRYVGVTPRVFRNEAMRRPELMERVDRFRVGEG